MARRSLRPHLNQIRGWVRQGRTDAWIAHQLEVTVQQIEAFKRENDLAANGDGEPAGVAGDFDDEIDLRAEDDALIAAELEAEQAQAEADTGSDDEESADEQPAPRSRRGRRGRGSSTGGGARRGGRAATADLEGTLDHREEGYGVWPHPPGRGGPRPPGARA